MACESYQVADGPKNYAADKQHDAEKPACSTSYEGLLKPLCARLRP